MVVRYHDNGWVGFMDVFLVAVVIFNFKMFTDVKVVFVAVVVVIVVVVAVVVVVAAVM